MAIFNKPRKSLAATTTAGINEASYTYLANTTSLSNQIISALGNYSTSSSVMRSGSTMGNMVSWTIPEALTEAQVIATRHILRLKELNPTELTEMADTIAEHCGVTPEIARSSLGVLKTLLTLGELQEKLER